MFTMVTERNKLSSPDNGNRPASRFNGLQPNPPKVPPSLIIRDQSLKQGFTQIPNAVLRDHALSPSLKMMYALLLSYAWHDDHCFPGHARLAYDMGLSQRMVIRILQTLKAQKLIDWDRPGQGKPNVYYINSLSDSYSQMVDKGKV